MEPREQHVLQRYSPKLIEQMEPNDFLKNLEILGAARSDGFEAVVRDLERQPRQIQAEWLLESLRKHNKGMEYLVRGLLLSEIQDFLAREILEDESFEENDVSAFLESLKDQLNEVQILKLQLLKERKKQVDTKRQLDEIKSNRTSAVFSDYEGSCCSGFDGSDVGFLLRELEEEKKRREAAEKRTTKLVETQQTFLRHFKSLEDVSQYKAYEGTLPWKAASVAELCSPEKGSNIFKSGSELTLTKWSSVDSGAQMREWSSCRNSFVGDENTSVLVLAEKVSSLEVQLEDEINKREEAEFEVMKLESVNRDLHDELFETRDQLFAASQLDLREDDLDEDMWDSENQEWDDQFITRRAGEKRSVSSYEGLSLGRGVSCPTLNQEDHFQSNQYNVALRPGGRRRSRSRPVSYHGDTGISRVWQNRNTEHYEMDQYDDEIKKTPDPRDKDFRFALRRLKLDTWKLYNDVLMGGTMIKLLGNRAKRISIDQEPMN